MQVQGATQTWTFQSPLTLELDIERGIWQSLSEGIFRIYNLGASTRSDVYQDWNNQGEYRQITLRAGYLSWSQTPGFTGPIQGASASTPVFLPALPFIFQGNIKQAYSQRQGPNWVTTISAWDGGFAVTNGMISNQLDNSVVNGSVLQTINTLVAAMPQVTVGYVDPTIQSQSVLGLTLMGSPWDKLVQLADELYADVYIDLEKVYFVKKGEAAPNVTGGLTLISPETGLLETPMKQRSIVSFEMIFEPRLKVGQTVNLQSLETVNNGPYTVGGINHRGMISDSVGGDLRTKVSCFYKPGYQPHGAIQ